MELIYNSPSSEFYKTYLLYREYIGYKKEYSYRKWCSLPEEYKVAALYVQFYNEITLAWYKTKTQWSLEIEGVEIINQYLTKNVEKIMNDKKRFSPRYIYKVAYNCLFCLCIDPTKNKERWEKEESNIKNSDGEEFDLFDTFCDHKSIEGEIKQAQLAEFIDSLDEELQIYVAEVLEELTEYQIISKLKKLDIYQGSVRDKESRNSTISAWNESCKDKIREAFLSSDIINSFPEYCALSSIG